MSLPDLEERIKNLEKHLAVAKASPKPLLEKIDFVEKTFQANSVKPQIALLQKSYFTFKAFHNFEKSRISNRFRKNLRETRYFSFQITIN